MQLAQHEPVSPALDLMPHAQGLVYGSGIEAATMARNPYRIDGPALVPFSGGRTSDYMLRQILDAHGGQLPAEVHDRNAHTHFDSQVAQIAASIVEFGFTNPILADGQGNVIAGHGRLAAAQRLGLDTVPLLVLDHLTEAPRRAYVLADNKLALNAGWDEELLAAELNALNGDGFDLGLTGFSDEERADLMAPLDDDAAGGGDDDDATPEPHRDPVSRPGDLWHFGLHRLLCGDSTDTPRSRCQWARTSSPTRWNASMTVCCF